MFKKTNLGYLVTAVLVFAAMCNKACAIYCPATGTYYFEYISRVQVGDINNISGNDHYANYTSLSTTMDIGQNYNITVTTGSPNVSDWCGIWVDWNQDQDFYDPCEVIPVEGNYLIFTATITPPDNAVSGDTRMRVRIRRTSGGSLSPCGTTPYGEVEDYTITVFHPDPNTRIFGKKWHDRNGNGEIDPNEPGLSGWTIFLDENRDGILDPCEVNTTTDSQGNYEFLGVAPDEYYNVSEVDQDGWINTYPGAGGIHYRIWMELDSDVEKNFGNYPLHNGDITGYEFQDVNNNGVWDVGEDPLGGWEIYLDENENGQLDFGEPNTITNASGYYAFTDLAPGYYNIKEVPKAGWFQTYPGLTSGRLWGLEGRSDSNERSTIAEVDLNTMTVVNRFTAPYNSIILGTGLLSAGPSTLFYCPLRMTSMETADSLFFEIDCETGLVINQGVLTMPPDEIAYDCTWHNGILYVVSFVIPIPSYPELPETYLNRYDPITMALLSRDQLLGVGVDSVASDPYEDKILNNWFTNFSLQEIDPATANVVNSIGQYLVSATKMAYTNGVLYKTHFNSDTIYALHREDGSLLSTQTITGHDGFDAIGGGIGVRGGHRVWIGKKDVEANFGNRLDSDGAFSGVKYEDLNGNGRRDPNESGMADWTIYIDLDGDLRLDGQEPKTVTDAEGNWTIGGLKRGRYFVREIQPDGYLCTEPSLGWLDLIEVTNPRDIVFDNLRNLLYVSTAAGEIERYDLSTHQFLTPVSVGGSPHGMDITSDYRALYVADIQLSGGSGVVHKIDLDTLAVAPLTYPVDLNEDGSYDIAIGSEGLALVTSSFSGSGWVPLHVLDTSTDIITDRPDVLGQSTINDDVRVIRSHDRNVIWLVNNSSNGWIGVYDAPSDTFVAEKEYQNYLDASPVALNRNGAKAAIQLDEHCRIVDSEFTMVMGLNDSKMGAEFDPVGDLYYQFHNERNSIYAIDTVHWQIHKSTGTGLVAGIYEKFTRGETAITEDGRVLGITDSEHVALHRREYYLSVLPGRTIGGIHFGNKPLLCGDIDGDRDVDLLDLGYLTEDWLGNALSLKYDSDIAGIGGPDGNVTLLDYACLAGDWGIDEKIIEYNEDFETGDFSNLPWEHDGVGPWTIDASTSFEGSYCAMSGAVPRYDESILKVTTTCGEGNLYFMLKTTSNGYFRFIVDGDGMVYWSDEILDWSLFMVPVSAGTHTFEWYYEPNSYGYQHAWIDAIRFPPK